MRGRFIVCEGTDGSGKATQAKLLVRRLQSEGIKTKYFDFPQYGKTKFGDLVGDFLKGELGNPDEIHPKLASLPYSLDRLMAAPEIRDSIKNGYWVVSSRYVLSNLSHRTAKLPAEQRDELVSWLSEVEYDLLKIPQEDANYFLYVPTDIRQSLLEKKGEREYMGGNGRDLMESDITHQESAADMYVYLATKFSRIHTLNCCNPEGNLMPIDKIHEQVWMKTVELYGSEITEARIKKERE